MSLIRELKGRRSFSNNCTLLNLMKRRSKKPEFKVGQMVTFKPYELAMKATVKQVLPNYYGDGEIIYHLVADRARIDGTHLTDRPVKSFSSGRCIVESKLFSPVRN